jgi:DNA-directed RNA polymerase specialized sigma subunit
MIQRKRHSDTPIDKTYRYLNKVKHIDDMINAKQQEIDSLRAKASSISVHTDSERVQSSGSKDKIGECCSRIVDLCAEINQDIDNFVNMKADVMHSIDLLENLEERKFLYCRYFQYMDFFKIAEDVFVSESKVYSVHRSAIRNLSEILFNDK